MPFLDFQVLFAGKSLLIETLKVFERFDLIGEEEAVGDGGPLGPLGPLGGGGGGGFVMSLFFSFSTSMKLLFPAEMALVTLHGLSIE